MTLYVKHYTQGLWYTVRQCNVMNNVINDNEDDNDDDDESIHFPCNRLKNSQYIKHL